MNIKINIKQLGKKRNKIAEQDFVLEHTPTTVHELICEAVHTCVMEYNQRVKCEEENKLISEEEISRKSEIGKIAFGINYGGKEAEEEKAVENAIQAYKDGLVRIFLGEEELDDLEKKIELSEGDSVTFIRLTTLSGSFW